MTQFSKIGHGVVVCRQASAEAIGFDIRNIQICSTEIHMKIVASLLLSATQTATSALLMLSIQHSDHPIRT
jgi:hypothetical protein